MQGVALPRWFLQKLRFITFFWSTRIHGYFCNSDSNFPICSLSYYLFFLFSSQSSWPGFVDSVSLYKQSISERKQIIRTEKDCFVTDRRKCLSDDDARLFHLETHCEYFQITTLETFLIKPFFYQNLLVFRNILNVPPFPHMPTTFVFQLSGKALGVEIKGETLLQWKARDWWNIVSGEPLLPWSWNGQGQRNITLSKYPRRKT